MFDTVLQCFHPNTTFSLFWLEALNKRYWQTPGLIFVMKGDGEVTKGYLQILHLNTMNMELADDLAGGVLANTQLSCIAFEVFE